MTAAFAKEPTRAPLARDVAIVGLGTAGAAAAIFLARAGHRVTLFERVPEPTAVGAGIMLQPTGQAVLRRLGLIDQILARGARIDSLRAEATTGRLLFDLHYAALRPDVYGVGLHRGVLFETLFAAVRQAPVQLELGVEIEGIQRARGHKRLLTDSSGEARGPFDLVVVADGARSHLAARDGPRKRVAHYPWGALWFVGHDEAQDNGPILRQVVRSTGTMIGLLPTGLGPGGASTPLVSLFYSLPVREFETWHQGFDDWKKKVATLAPRAAPVLDQIQRPTDILFAAYHDVVMRPWHGEGLVHLGDAAPRHQPAARSRREPGARGCDGARGLSFGFGLGGRGAGLLLAPAAAAPWLLPILVALAHPLLPVRPWDTRAPPRRLHALRV